MFKLYEVFDMLSFSAQLPSPDAELCVLTDCNTGTSLPVWHSVARQRGSVWCGTESCDAVRKSTEGLHCCCALITGSTAMPTCCKGDCWSQWQLESPIFSFSHPGNPL